MMMRRPSPHVTRNLCCLLIIFSRIGLGNSFGFVFKCLANNTRNCRWHGRQWNDRTSLRHVAPVVQTSALLCNGRGNTTDAPEQIDIDLYVTISDSRLLAVDVVSIALAVQLLGLVDVLNDPSFWQQGGWFQPVSLIDSSLPVLVQRESIITVCWLISALGWKGYSGDEGVQNTIRIVASFVILRFVLGITMLRLGASEFDALEIVRQCYYTTILVGWFRFVYAQYIN